MANMRKDREGQSTNCGYPVDVTNHGDLGQMKGDSARLDTTTASVDAIVGYLQMASMELTPEGDRGSKTHAF